MEVKLGKYRHYKGKEYEVLAIGTHTETLEKVVVYMALYDDPEFGNNAIWVRPFDMFIENVNIDGKDVPRFELIEELVKD